MEYSQKCLDEKFCRDCGKVIKQRAEICPHCGCRQLQPLNLDKNRIIVALLALFLGGFGIHKFYLGKTGAGIVYLVFFWTFIPTIIGFIEGIIYLCMSEDEFQRKY
ncbi:MAG: NINE protein [Bdellovibrionota bacterium]